MAKFRREKTESKSERKLDNPKMKLDRRYLPSDFNKLKKYHALSNTEKKIVERPGDRKGFFRFPNQIKGIQELNIKDFLVFYFDSKEDYVLVKKFFEVPSHAKVHPILDEKKLALIVREKMEAAKK